MRSDNAIAIVIAIVIAEMISQRLRLEAYTLSNRGRSLRIVNTVKTTGWKPVPKQSVISNQQSTLIVIVIAGSLYSYFFYSAFHFALIT